MANTKTQAEVAETLIMTLANAQGATLATFPMPKVAFDSGKLGWGAYGRTILPDGTPIQISANFAVPHSEVDQSAPAQALRVARKAKVSAREAKAAKA